MASTRYPYEFTNIHAFVQRVALDMVRYGYVRYVTGTVPDGRDPRDVDAKILAKYDIAVSKYVRCRRKAAGRANIHYARHQSFFVMLAPAKGEHRWFEDEEWQGDRERKLHGRRIRDLAKGQPLVHGGYSISYKESSSSCRAHVSVRIHPDEYRALKAYYLDMALHRSAERLSDEFRRFPFEPYQLIRGQRWNIWHAVNARRKRANYEQVPASSLRKWRVPFKYLREVA